MKNKNLYGQIKVLELKLNDTIKKYGLEDRRTIELSAKIDDLINYYYFRVKEREYPQNSFMYVQYKLAYDKLRELTDVYGDFPSIEEWNKYAMKNSYLSAESIKYISRLDWRDLRIKIKRKLIIKDF